MLTLPASQPPPHDLGPRRFSDPRAQAAFASLAPMLEAHLAHIADPERVLINLERLAQSVQASEELFQSLTHQPRRLEALLTLFAGSQYLSEILLRHPEYLSRLGERAHLAHAKTAEQLCAEALTTASSSAPDEALDALRRFQQRELLRIGAADLLGMLDLPTVTRHLAHLAEALVRACLAVASKRFNTVPAGFAVLALGKLGGEELNYSSDIDLVFLARSDPSAYHRLAEALIDALTRATAEGFLYRVDMRLRPWGQTGPLVPSLAGYLGYLQKSARLWEKQALLKARTIAGDDELGSEFLRRATPLLFGADPETVRADVREMKQRIEAQLSSRAREWGEVKLGKGSIRDVEFVAQYLQLVHGARYPELCCGNTLDALARLFAAGVISAEDHRVLATGYTFLRPIEHYLQVMHYRQTHQLPTDVRELNHLARRLGFEGEEAGAHFSARYQQHSAAIRAVYQRYLESEGTRMDNPSPHPPTPDISHHIERMAPSYTTVFSEAEVRRHAELAERLDEQNLVQVDALPLDGGDWRVTIVGYDYPGELSLICGLLFAYGFSIQDGHVFTYEPLHATAASASAWAGRARPREKPDAPADARRKIVDVFRVHPVSGAASEDLWPFYVDDLTALLRRLQHGQQREAHGDLAKRVALAVQDMSGTTTALQPIDIDLDNDISERYTVLRIDAPDTIGFLYELTSALALNGIYIARVTVDSASHRAHDTLYLTDRNGHKITSPEKQRELRVATVLVKHFTHLLPHSPNPESALLHFHEFLGQLFMRPEWPDELATLERPEVLGALARLLGVSDFLWDDFLRMQHANLFAVVRDVGGLAQAKTAGELRAELDAALQSEATPEGKRAALNAFKDREMFRIDMRHIQGHIAEFGQFSAELSDLAEVVVDAAFRFCRDELYARHGTPLQEDGQPCPVSVCALGKCGGRELGYASDIELMFVFAGSGMTTGPEMISSVEFHENLVIEFTRAIRSKREGIFEIDLRLRPYGSAGSMAVSLTSFRRYFAPGGAAWPYERQALIKLHPIAGDAGLGQQLLVLRDEFVYAAGAFDVAAMRAMRERQLRHLVAGGTLNAKYSLGGLVDAEYLVQGLQTRYGKDNPALRPTNTREAIAALASARVLSPEDHRQLAEAYAFLRQLIDALRMVRGNARDLSVPPPSSDEFAFLARRMNYGRDLARLRDDLTRHSVGVQQLLARLLG